MSRVWEAVVYWPLYGVAWLVGLAVAAPFTIGAVLIPLAVLAGVLVGAWV